MLLVLIFAVVTTPLLLAAACVLLGFRLGGDHWRTELGQARIEAVQAERQLFDLTRDAFTAMAEHAERLGPDAGRPPR